MYMKWNNWLFKNYIHHIESYDHSNCMNKQCISATAAWMSKLAAADIHCTSCSTTHNTMCTNQWWSWLLKQQGYSWQFFFEAPSPGHWLMTTLPNNWCQKSWSLHIQGRWKSLYQRITLQLTKLLHILCHLLFLSLQSTLSLVWILSYNNFFLHGVSFVALSTPSSFMREHHPLRFGEEIWRLMLPHSPPEALSLVTAKGKVGVFFWKSAGFCWEWHVRGYNWR